GLDVDVRCACLKDPNSKLCEMVKAGFYEPRDWRNAKPLNLGIGGTIYQPATKTTRTGAPARPEQARVVPLAHKDYLRFLHPNAYMVAGFDFEKLFRSAELMGVLFGQADNDD